MHLTRRLGFSALAVAILMVTMSAARADVKVNVNAAGASATSSMKFKIEGIPNPGPCGPYINEPLWNPGPGSIGHYCVGLNDPTNNRAVGQAQYFGPGTSVANPSWCVGDAQAGGGGLHTETLPDSAMACVGLYQAPGGTALGSNPDSLLRVNIARSGTTVTLTIPTINVNGVPVGSGGMQIRQVNANQTMIAEWRLIVYPNQAAADGDVNTDGFGSSFFGKAVLESGTGVPTGLSTYGGFTGADFVVQDQGGGKLTLRPVAGFSKNAMVPDASTAVVVLFSDPRSLDRPVAVPSSTPIGLVLLALALLASGLWVIRSRRGVQAA